MVSEMSQTLLIPCEFPDLNTYIRVERGNRFAAAQVKEDATYMVKYQAGVQRIKPALEPVTIIIHWFSKNKRKDPDNIAFAKKFILDGLVKAGVLHDDGQDEILGFTDTFHVDKTKPRVEIVLYGKY